MLDTKKLGKRIAFLRKQNGMSQEKLAEILCITPQAISKWENGHTTPETALLPVLAQLFQCSIDEIIMPVYLFDSDIEEKKPNRLKLQTRQIADYIVQQLGSAMSEEKIGLRDAEILEALRRVYPNIGNCQIVRGKPETHERYQCTYITVTTPQRELRLVEKVYHGDDKELSGYELFSRYVTAVPQIYCLDHEKKILLMDEVTDSIQGVHFDEDNENGSIFRNHYRVILQEIAKVHAAFWERESVFQEIGLDLRHRAKENLLAHIDGMEQDFLRYRKKEETGRIPKVWNGMRNGIAAEKLDRFQDAIQFLRQRYLPLADERFHTGKNVTIIHGDLHPGNLFLTKLPESPVKMIDMEAVRVGLCTEDLAMLMALHIEPDKKDAQPLLNHYYKCLRRSARRYSYGMFMDDYKIAVAEALFYPIRLINRGIYDFDMRDRAIRAYETFVTA